MKLLEEMINSSCREEVTGQQQQEWNQLGVREENHHIKGDIQLCRIRLRNLAAFESQQQVPHPWQQLQKPMIATLAMEHSTDRGDLLNTTQQHGRSKIVLAHGDRRQETSSDTCDKCLTRQRNLDNRFAKAVAHDGAERALN
ncbi:hypothetical protein PIB30_067297 [Stylosanthes scabra]|uniref:Uncharacterized protein n=1 Tax=Stylosanthes scabra TaxID=79078 RepID=A0ABU6UM21_9FABA|nr:hypothetical protein [Stylosanthes scabra]